MTKSYFKRKALDFIFATTQGIVPVEVKSGAAGKLRSLHQFMLLSQAQTAVRLYAGAPVCHNVSS